MLPPYDFVARFKRLDHAVPGSIDEVSWIGPYECGNDHEAVPRGSALYVRGWALDLGGAGPATTVAVQVDGGRTYAARTGLARPDVAMQLDNAALGGAGFEAAVPTGLFGPGPHRVEVLVVDGTAGRYAAIAGVRSFTLVDPMQALPTGIESDLAALGNIDEVFDESGDVQLLPTNGSLTVSRGTFLFLRGWACLAEPALPFRELYAVLDNERAVRAAYGGSRPDIVKSLASSSADAVGFDIRLSTTGLALGTHLLRLAGVTADGSLVRTPVRFELIVGDTLPTHVSLDETTLAHLDDVVRIEHAAAIEFVAPLRLRRGDRLFVRGWAIDQPAASVAVGVSLMIDDTREVRALYGLPRPDVARALGDEGLLHCGFTADIATDDLSAGLHRVTCRVAARDGRGAFKTAQQFAFEVTDS